MNYENIIYEKKHYVANITFNRPKALNSLTLKMIQEIGHALGDAEEDDTIRVVVITGSGRAFCTGADLKFAREEMNTFEAQERFFRIGDRELLGKIQNHLKPVIVAVNGIALAGGFEMMCAADFVIAVEDAVIGEQHINFGLIGAGGSPYRLPFIVGLRKAKELTLTGRRISGKEAERIGLVNLAVPADKLESTVNELAAELAEKSPVAMRLTKALINRTMLIDYQLRVDFAAMSQLINMRSEDYQEGISAFVNKRQPVWKGK